MSIVKKGLTTSNFVLKAGSNILFFLIRVILEFKYKIDIMHFVETQTY